MQDLPFEVIERILFKVVVVEVLGRKLAKRVWKEKADLVTAQLGTVCPQWNRVLTTNYFQTRLHIILDGLVDEIDSHLVSSSI